MQTAIVLPMDQERENKEDRYLRSRDEMREFKKQLDEMTRILGSVDEAIKGNDRGTEGLVRQFQTIRETHKIFAKQIEVLEERLYKIEVDMKNRLKIWGLVFTLAGIVLGTLFKAFIDKFSKK